MPKAANDTALSLDQPLGFSTKQAGKKIGRSPSTMNRMRVDGTGPKFYRKNRRIYYRLADLEAWLTSDSHHSTSEYSDE